MAGQPNMDADLERAEPGPSIQRAHDDGQRNERVCAMIRDESKNVTVTAGDNSAFVAAWMQRLQMLTLITTFLASIDGELFILTSTPLQASLDASLDTQELMYACFTGALVFHVCAGECQDGLRNTRHLRANLAILGYVASFALIRYQMVDIAPSVIKNAELSEPSNPGLHHPETHRTQCFFVPIPPSDAVNTLFQMPKGLQVQSRTSTPPLDLLTRCYFTTLALGSAGFILALLGIATYAWVVLRQTVGIFTTACLGVSIVACVWAVM
ncbi:hypothetical protein DFH29DRAFT_449289 [Suillus ampliporus]|nr:hypothetical protein DFH29DRAFT_449289 [Suillus ampliporus]